MLYGKPLVVQLGQKLLVKPSKLARKLKLEDWNTEYDAKTKKENVERELDRLSRQMSELQYIFVCKNQSLLIILQRAAVMPVSSSHSTVCPSSAIVLTTPGSLKNIKFTGTMNYGCKPTYTFTFEKLYHFLN